jgi:ubiquinone/menaquinone biosynthesis C-methylase UbiE
MDKIQKFWDKQAQRYDSGEKQFDLVYNKVISKTKTHLEANDTVLDYGCATGTKTLNLAESVKQIYGIDISSEMIKKANEKRNENRINNAEFGQGTIFNNDFSDIKFDKIIAYSILHLLENNEEVLRKIHELLKPGGIFISLTACLKDKMAIKMRAQFFLYSLMKKIGMFPLHLGMFTFPETEDLIRKAKFGILESECIFEGMTISYIVARKT